MIFKEKQKSQPISRLQVWDSFKKVKRNGGTYGVDKMSISEVSAQPRKYLYPIWNRLASGSYFPQPVREVEIPKNGGGKRKLGIPTVQDRVAQMVIREELEPQVDKYFSSNSYGYRPNKSAHQAIKQCKSNCISYPWAIDLDIKGFFDEIDHNLMIKSLSQFTQDKHIHLYVKRWLACSISKKDGSIQKRVKGTPQGGVISPLLANIFLHFVFDKWMAKNYPQVKFERYADDIIVHCKSLKESLRVLDAIKLRFEQCKLQIKAGKSNIILCKVYQGRKLYGNRKVSFDFLGFTFQPRIVVGRFGKLQLGFTPSISRSSQKRVNRTMFKMKIHRMVHLRLPDLAVIIAPKVRGWIHYYGKFRKSDLRHIFRVLNMRLCKWVRNKYRRFRNRHWYHAYKWLQNTAKHYPYLFVHWQHGFTP